jgi:hypothetical protein
LGQYNRGLVGSLAPFQGYLGAAGDIEALGQQPLELGSALGGRIANPQGATALSGGGSRAAQYMFGANQLNPTANFLQGLSSNQQLTSALGQQAQSLFSRNTPAYDQKQMRNEIPSSPSAFSDTYFGRRTLG